jgi:hypothetical protein
MPRAGKVVLDVTTELAEHGIDADAVLAGDHPDQANHFADIRKRPADYRAKHEQVAAQHDVAQGRIAMFQRACHKTVQGQRFIVVAFSQVRAPSHVPRPKTVAPIVDRDGVQQICEQRFL